VGRIRRGRLVLRFEGCVDWTTHAHTAHQHTHLYFCLPSSTLDHHSYLKGVQWAW
jgi:hypothetical protein